MGTRIVTGIIMAIVAISILTMAPPWVTYVVIQLAVLICADEFYRITLADGPVQGRIAGILTCGAIVAVVWFAQELIPVVILGSTIALLCVVLFSSEPVERMGPRAANLLAGFLYVGCLLAAVAEITRGWGPGYILLLFAGVFTGDTGAFFAGKFLGNKKLYEKISPKKTWAGAVGGLVASVGGIFLVNSLNIIDQEFSPLICVVLGAGIAILEQVGDLAESLFKRAYDVKDSGTILPGHGGLLDRIDGLLFAAPYMWVILAYVV